MADKSSAELKMEIISPVFRGGTPIPSQYSCEGQNINPPLNIFNAPKGSQSLTLVVHDPDAPAGDYLHWLVWDIPPKTESIAVNSVPIGALQGLNDSGRTGYTGPCPPPGSGTHRYVFELYALDTPLNLEAGSPMAKVIKGMRGRVLDHCALIGTYMADP